MTNELELMEFEEDLIRKELMFTSIESVEGNVWTLNNGKKLEVTGNEGCACGAGEYYVEKILPYSNCITGVYFETIEDGTTAFEYKILVVSFNIPIPTEILNVVGDDGSGYYGTGYTITVRSL